MTVVVQPNLVTTDERAGGPDGELGLVTTDGAERRTTARAAASALSGAARAAEPAARSLDWGEAIAYDRNRLQDPF